ncbi:MAG TPA: alpha-2-macroglobulin family protein, partial [Bacteroidia bacterium]|nr:alpha-2-macroglobulin family protein [Bacteroidia bacterium]
NPDYFSPAVIFTTLPLNSPDTMSMDFYALRTLQTLEKMHFPEKDPDALVDVELERLLFVHNKSVDPDKDSLYEMGLRQLAANYPDSKITAEVLYQLAVYHNSLGAQYVPGKDEKYRWERKRALDICNAVIQKYPGTPGAYQCSIIRNDITAKNVSFTVQDASVPGKPSPGLLTYRNFSHVYFRIASVPQEYVAKTDYRTTEQVIKDYLALPVLQSWDLSLPADSDYADHSVEIKIPDLPAGKYVILSSVDKDFTMMKNAIAYTEMWSTTLGYVQRQLTDGSFDFLVFDRENGGPLEGVSAQVWYQSYDYVTRDYRYKKGDRYFSDKDGRVNVPPAGNYRTFFLELSSGGNHFITGSSYQYKPYNAPREMRPQTFFFTDRSIYRPGQTIYFKGIIVNTDGDNNKILPHKTTTVTFYDVNYQKVTSLNLETNDYGSFSGTFTAPSAGLTGQMHIQNESGSEYFSVEEYKRPKFDITTQPVKGAYRLNDSVFVKGSARTFAGSAVDGAKVTYTVTRSASFPWWYYYWWGYYPNSQTAVISNGEVMTNDTGGFVIPFKALPDKSVPKSSSPTFNYTINIDVTDITGETHSTSAYVNVGYVALELSVNADNYIEKSDTAGIPVSLTNLSGEPESSMVSVSIHRLNDPGKIYKDRQWQVPDKFIYTKDDWTTTFPDLPYKEENKQVNWTKGSEVYSGKYNTGKEKSLRLKNKDSWKPGSYIIEATAKDKYGQEVKDVKYFTLYDIRDKMPASKEAWSFQAINTNCQPGDKAVFLVGTSGKNVKVLYETEIQGKIASRQWLTLNEEQKYIEIPVEEKHRGNFAVHFAMVYHNQAYTSDAGVSVPWESKQLDFEYETFRNKLIPGQKEEWKIKIKGPKGDKVAAEMVAAMYDASLDQFRSHNWSFYLYKSYYGSLYWQHGVEGTATSALYAPYWNDNSLPDYQYRTYDQLNWFGFYFSYGNYWYGYDGNGPGYLREEMDEDNLGVSGGVVDIAQSKAVDKSKAPAAPPPADAATGSPTFAFSTSGNTAHASGEKNTETTALMQDSPAAGKDYRNAPNLNAIAARQNLNETVFFFPQLETDSTGTVIIKFTMNEALTKWKFMAFAHTKDLMYGQTTKEVVTQKDLMVMPNAPRFFREGDKITFTAKVSNLTDKDMTGDAQLMLFDALTMQPVDAKFLNNNAKLSFTAKKGQSAPLSWDLIIPYDVSAVTYRVVAQSGNFTDGEESSLPVLSNRMLVTETMPIWVKQGETKEFRFEKLLSMNGGSTTLRNQRLTLEFTSNPAWYAVQALPYMMEYPYECSEQTFDRLYSNSIASNIANSSPKIRAVFDAWKTQSPDAFLSNLEKNQDLKNVVLTETPWVLDAKDETERKRRVGLLFDMNRMADEQDRTIRKLRQMQSPNGGWPWFEDMPDDRYITQYIVTGFGHLDKLGVKSVREDNRNWNMITSAMQYLDNRVREDYDWILKYDKDHMNEDHLSDIAIQYLYARSFFPEIPMTPRNKTAFDYYYGQSQKYWLGKGNFMEGMIALELNRYNDKKTSGDIMKSLTETALHSDEMGMYWKDNSGGYYWYQAPIETQSLLIEAFKEVKNDQKSVDDMRIWLLKNKQTNDWKTTVATADACYALLIDGTSWLATESNVEIVVGSQKIDPKKLDVPEEAGTGYFKTAWSGDAITPDMGKVTVTKTGPGISWGAMYWQYFEDMDKITPAQTPLSVSKKLFLVKKTSSGEVMEPVTDQTVLHPGDKIRVRVELRNDRDMEYIHMKDMRAAGFEPVNVLSQYKWQDGLGYYESTKDASTDFFFSFLPKGTHVFEYPLTVVNAGDFSNGITEVQCMYAPEFSCHSEGIRVKVAK